MSSLKNIETIIRVDKGHWVGNGFPVRTYFDYREYGQLLSPFLLLDYAGPVEFNATNERRGVGQHPHRGFETVTIVYDGEVAHQDSTGQGGVIGPGDVQWMTAAGGILHEEFHSTDYAKRGGPFEMVQLWVNLPAANKMDSPSYQAILNSDIAQVDLPQKQGAVRVIAGEYQGVRGAAKTHSPMQVWDVRLAQDAQVEFTLPEGWSIAVLLLRGELDLADEQQVARGEMAVLSREGSIVNIHARQPSSFLLLSGENLNEPIAGHGPFVMNTKEELVQASKDFMSGQFGHIKQSQ